MNDSTPHQPSSPAATFGVCALTAIGGAGLACIVWLMAFFVTFAGALFVGVHWLFVVTAAAMLLPGLFAFSKILPIRWMAIGFTLPTLIVVLFVLLQIATSGVPQLPPNFS